MDIINYVPAARPQPRRVSQRSRLRRYFTKEVALAVVLIGLPCLGWYFPQARVARHRQEVNLQAQRAAHETHRRLQAIADERKGTLTGFGFRWFPTNDVTGAAVPRPGAGKPMIIVFGGQSDQMLSAPAWKHLLDQHPKAVLLAVMQGKTETVQRSATKVKRDKRMFLIADPNHLLHNMFNATQRVFVFAGSGKAHWHHDPIGWEPSTEIIQAIDSTLKKAGA